ncbi:hypothetical protein EJ03DRAFT_319701 [Teratosphaeria nubilosa]|uniref:Phosphatidate phosphatase APP1 catalytic domain-containing protein n=1 Tax=Teratosphaeria nubilosa TaxID=161662 RepID=A0A6G1KZ18_9PEZI|nr:hypothetical protein EJ03DRAFT_319701 [Teratosphaeria nubilosa]
MTLAARSLLLPAALCVLVAAGPLPGPTPVANRVEERDPIITPAADLDWRALDKRALSDITAEIGRDVNSVLSGLGSDLPSYIASGIPQYFQGLPTGDAVASSLGIGDSELAAVPTNVLNIDPYANFTDQGWNVRFHGNVYKQPNTSEETLNKLAGALFIYGEDFNNLTASEQAMARNLTAEIFVVQQGNVAVNTIHLEPASSQGSSGEPGGGGGTTNTTGGTQDITLPYNTTAEGDFDVFVPIASNGLTAGNETSEIQRLNTHVEGASLGNSTAYLVPNEGLTVISDIDDILRVTKIYEPKQGLLNSFARPFTAWENMPSIYANWSQSIEGIHFHYLTTTPEQVTRNYMQFIYSTYPGGSFDTRPLNFSDVSATLSIRKFLLVKIFESFPQRKFVLVADTSNSDVMRDYPEMVTLFPGQVQCILLRNTTSTDPGDKFPYDTSGFKGLNQSMYMFFKNADDLTDLDIASGQCYNTSIPQNVTFSTQGLPFGLSSTTSTNGSANSTSSNTKSGAGTLSSNMGLGFFGFLVVILWQLL